MLESKGPLANICFQWSLGFDIRCANSRLAGQRTSNPLHWRESGLAGKIASGPLTGRFRLDCGRRVPTFPKFVLRLSTAFHELRKGMGTTKLIDSSAAFLFEVSVE